MALSDLYKPKPRRRYMLDDIYDQLSTEDQQMLLEALADTTIEAARIAEELTAMGYVTTDQNIRYARRRRWEPLA